MQTALIREKRKTMREKELRLALVCFGGVSLAIYMHGVTKEILKLARASAAYHKNPDSAARRSATYDDFGMNGSDEVDTEAIYFEILQALGKRVELRVIVDAVAGASAGGINGLFLARALAHDLGIDPLRAMWLDEADVSKLASTAMEAPTFWTRFVVRPIVDALAKRFMGPGGLRQRVSEKLPSILRVRRLQPPFDGPHLVRLLYDAFRAMGRPKTPGSSLMPSGHRLEAFVTVTDFYGYVRKIPLHDPPVITEREHRVTLNFSYVSWPGGAELSDFEEKDLPALVFAARATSSFPGAYPPVQLKEIERALADRNVSWEHKEGFIRRNFRDYLDTGLDPDRTAFIDGSVLNNKPFAHAIRSIEGRPAYREVDRRIVYIDPTPEAMTPPPSGIVPSLWRTLKGALSDIPRNEPMHDDLAEIDAFNDQVRTIRSVIDAIKPSVNRHMATIMVLPATGPVDASTIRRWRIAANIRAATDAGYSYEGYTRLKLRKAIGMVVDLLAEVCEFPRDGTARTLLFAVIEAWVMHDPIDFSQLTIPEESLQDPDVEIPNWIRFLLNFDVGYQRRQIRFVIRETNSLYERSSDALVGLEPGQIDRLKERFYQCLASLRRFDDRSFLGEDLRAQIRKTFIPLGQNTAVSAIDPKTYFSAHRKPIGELMENLGTALDLASVKHAADAILAEIHGPAWPEALTRELLVAYLGFGFWDVISYSIMGTRDIGEFNEIKVDRISPEDAKTLASGKTGLSLKGVAMRNFGAFFSRKDRENDYIFGRMNAAERLIDILLDEARQEGASRGLSVRSLKKRAFTAILQTEEKHLKSSEILIDRLKRRLADL
ncbi:MAG: patatin-like protein [Alphaproteobacteria bacterium]|nr:MAG: patatin-like protein [Alphaproteobacteria bacterium]